MKITEATLTNIISESVKNVLIEMVDEYADASFEPNDISQCRSFAEMVRYCKTHCGNHIGKGSSREVFEIDDNKCIKLAFNKKGAAQNEEEVRSYANECGLTPEIYSYDENNYMWIVVQKARPARAGDFRQLLGMDFKKYCYYVDAIYAQYGRYVKSSNYEQEVYDYIYEGDNEFLYNLNDYMENTCLEKYGDLKRISSYGVVEKDGQSSLVLIDAGLSDKVFDQHYGRR